MSSVRHKTTFAFSFVEKIRFKSLACDNIEIIRIKALLIYHAVRHLAKEEIQPIYKM
jgi:hypothetical protein